MTNWRYHHPYYHYCDFQYDKHVITGIKFNPNNIYIQELDVRELILIENKETLEAIDDAMNDRYMISINTFEELMALINEDEEKEVNRDIKETALLAIGFTIIALVFMFFI